MFHYDYCCMIYVQMGQPDLMLPRSMFVNREKYAVQMNAYSRLIAGTVFLVHEQFGFVRTRDTRFGHEIAEEIIRFETQLAKVFVWKNVFETNACET